MAATSEFQNGSKIALYIGNVRYFRDGCVNILRGTVTGADDKEIRILPDGAKTWEQFYLPRNAIVLRDGGAKLAEWYAPHGATYPAMNKYRDKSPA